MTRSIRRLHLRLSENTMSGNIMSRNTMSGNCKGSVTRWIIAAMVGIFLLCFAPPENLSAQGRQEKARLLLDKCLESVGGEAFLRMRTLKQTGRAYSFYRKDLSGLAVITIFNEYGPPEENEDPNWLPVSRREVYTQKGDYYTLFQNGKGWEVTYLGARPLPEDQVQRYRISTRRDIFHILRYRLDEPGMYFYYAGTEVVSNVPTHAIEITDSEGEKVTVYLRMSDNLPIQQDYLRRDPKTRIPFEEKWIYSKYRLVGGVKVPWNVQHVRDEERIFELFGRTGEIDGKVPGDTFRLRNGAKILSPSD